MRDADCVAFLQWALPRMRMRWAGFRKVRRQVARRLARRLGELGLPDLDSYREILEREPDEWQVLDGLCRITISRFYRDRRVFDGVRDRVLPALAAQVGERGLRCCSVGCASGEEPYTLALIWLLAAERPGVPLLIAAVDADARLLERARVGLYPASSLKDLPQGWREAGFERVGARFRILDRFRAPVEWIFADVRDALPPGPFDLVLCRNLSFTYFDEHLQQEVLERLARSARPGAALVAGAHERPPAVAALEAWPEAPSVWRFNRD